MASSCVSAAAHLLLGNGSLLRPLRLSTTASTTSLSLLRRHYPKLSSSLPLHSAVLLTHELEPDEPVEDAELEPEEQLQSGGEKERKIIVGFVREERQVPNLTVKEKKELGSYANGLGDKLKSQQVGKSGVTDNVIFAFNETLEKRELLKLKIHKSCPGELVEVVSEIERGTGSVAVFQIGRIVIFYRPSITKMKAEEKKEQNRRLFAQKKKNAQIAIKMNNREQGKRPGQGYRGSRNFEKSPS